MVCMSSGQVSELLGQPETVPHMLGRHKVLRHLDTAVQVVHLSTQKGQMCSWRCEKNHKKQAGLLNHRVCVQLHFSYKNSLTWWGAPAGINTASPKNCTMAQPWTPYSS